MKRQHTILLVALFALLGSLTAAFATQIERDYHLRGYVDATQEINLPYRLPLLGVNVELTQYTPAELEQQLNLIEAAHVVWLRQLVRWDDIEPERGQFNWTTWDSLVEAVDARPRLRLVAVLMNTPEWARPSSTYGYPTTPPDNPADFASFAHQFARRYAASIDYYQIWDEPNLTAAWGGFEPRAADYAALVRETYPAVHGADAGAAVILGALAPTVELGPQNISDIRYLSDLYALGIRPFMDAAAAKPYGFASSPFDREVSPQKLNFSRIVALREIMVQHGDGAKPLWASSWGWNSLPDDWTGEPSIWGSVDTETQAAYVQGGLDRAAREWPWLGAMILYHWQPAAAAADPQWGFAIINQQGQTSVLWQSLVDRPQPVAATNGLYPPQNAFARYSGVWTFGRMGADIGWLKDSQLEFSFSGTDISLLLRQDDYVGYLYPLIDGKPANAVPRDAAGAAYVVLTSGSLSPELSLVPVSRQLAPGDHLLSATADRGWDRWALAGYAVSSGDLAAPYNRQITLAWLASVTSAAALWVVGRSIHWSAFWSPLYRLWLSLNNTGQIIIGALTSVALMIGMLMTWGDHIPALFRREPIQLGLAFLTAGLIYLEPGLILTLVAGVLLFFIIYNRLEIGLMLTVFWSPFFLFPVELYRFAFPLSEILILLTTAAWVLRLLVLWGQRRTAPAQPMRLPRPTLLDYAVLFWLALGFVSLLWTERRAPAITELRVMMVEPTLFYLIIRTTQLKQRSLLSLIDALLAAGFAVAVIGLFQFIQGQAVITAEEGVRRLASVYGSPNNVGLFLGRCIPFALAFAVSTTDRPRRLLALGTLLTMIAAVILSQSAGALFLGVPAALFTVLMFIWGRRGRLILLILVVVIAVAFVLSLQSARFARVLDFDSGTNFFRIRVWQSALNMIADHPLTGLGLDQFLYAFRGHYILPDAWQEPNLSHPHNFVLDFWVRLGILGVSAFIIMQIGFWRQVWRFYRNARPDQPLEYILIIGAVGCMINLLAHGLVDNSVYVQDLVYVFVLILALVVGLQNGRAIDEPL